MSRGVENIKVLSHPIRRVAVQCNAYGMATMVIPRRVADASVILCVRALKGKRIELSTPNLVHIYSAWINRRSKGQRSSQVTLLQKPSRSHIAAIVGAAAAVC